MRRAPDSLPKDPRLRAAAWAVFAPSPLNTQPWKLELRGADTLLLRTDSSRLLKFTDPGARQTWISHGCFLEALALAAREWGYAVDFDIQPEPGIVAAARFYVDAAPPDPLFSSLRFRQTNRRKYEPVALTAVELSEMGGLARYFCEPAEIKKIAKICRDAAKIAVASQVVNRESVAWMRFDSQELAARRDGIGMAQSGLGKPSQWLLDQVSLDRDSAADPEGSLSMQSVKMLSEQAASASAFGVIASASNLRVAQIDAGRDFLRIHLRATRLGLCLHPLSHVLEDHEGMEPLRARLREVLQVPLEEHFMMFFRIGRAEPVEFSPRRPLQDFLEVTS